VAEKRKILFLGDSVSGFSGLGRIHRDVATRCVAHLSDVFNVATIGIGAPPSAEIPLRQYPVTHCDDWIIHDLPYAWKDHVGDRADGILFSFWDVSRLLWMVYPEQCPNLVVRDFLLNFKGEKWVYPAVDGAGPNGRMPAMLADALSRFDRVLNYTEFSARITGYPDVCTHGIDTSVFYPRSGAREAIAAKFAMNLEPGERLIGIVATNQPRKDWALAFGALALLKQQGIKATVWIHTDTDMRHWDLKALYVDFGLAPDIRAFVTPYGLPDDDLAALYSACDVTIGPGVEGFGYPAAESLCCGTPHVTGSYGGQADFVPEPMQIHPIAYRYEGVFAVQRPVHDSAKFAERIRYWLPDRWTGPACGWDAVAWNSVWPKWEQWFRDGL
jgi:glycosyltransferase involved in cell wall biosynthesis